MTKMTIAEAKAAGFRFTLGEDANDAAHSVKAQRYTVIELRTGLSAAQIETFLRLERCGVRKEYALSKDDTYQGHAVRAKTAIRAAYDAAEIIKDNGGQAVGVLAAAVKAADVNTVYATMCAQADVDAAKSLIKRLERNGEALAVLGVLGREDTDALRNQNEDDIHAAYVALREAKEALEEAKKAEAEENVKAVLAIDEAHRARIAKAQAEAAEAAKKAAQAKAEAAQKTKKAAQAEKAEAAA